MRELLQKLRPVTDRLSKLGNGDADGNSDGNVLAQHARNLIDEALSRSKWVKVADGLPVVPNGEDYAEVWVVVRGEVREDAFGQQISEDGMSLECGSGFCSDGVTHWKYKYTPAPPEDL